MTVSCCQISAIIRWIAVKFCTDIDVPLWLNPNYFCDSLTEEDLKRLTVWFFNEIFLWISWIDGILDVLAF